MIPIDQRICPHCDGKGEDAQGQACYFCDRDGVVPDKRFWMAVSGFSLACAAAIFFIIYLTDLWGSPWIFFPWIIIALANFATAFYTGSKALGIHKEGN